MLCQLRDKSRIARGVAAFILFIYVNWLETISILLEIVSLIYRLQTLLYHSTKVGAEERIVPMTRVYICACLRAELLAVGSRLTVISDSTHHRSLLYEGNHQYSGRNIKTISTNIISISDVNNNTINCEGTLTHLLTPVNGKIYSLFQN